MKRSCNRLAAAAASRLKIFFDLDNTLYRYDRTTIETDWISKTVAELTKLFPGLTPKELKEMDVRYHKQYGMIPTGLAHDFPGTFDPVKFVKDTHEFKYDGVVPCPETQRILAKLDALGHDLWIFTNGDMPHIENVLRLMEIRKYFLKKDEVDDSSASVKTGIKPSSSSSSSSNSSGTTTDNKTALKCVDVFTQWRGVPNQRLFNKPMEEAYIKALGIANAESATMSHITHGDNEEDPQRCVMIEDSFANLQAPAKLGWKTIWISYGRPLPIVSTGHSPASTYPTFTPTCVIDSLLQLEEATFLFQPIRGE